MTVIILILQHKHNVPWLCSECGMSPSHPMLLNGDICEMHKHIVQFVDTSCVLDRTESTETKVIPNKRELHHYCMHVTCMYTHVRLEGTEWGDQDIEPEVKFLPSNEQWVVNVTRDDVYFSSVGNAKNSNNNKVKGLSQVLVINLLIYTFCLVPSLDHLLTCESLLMRNIPTPWAARYCTSLCYSGTWPTVP